MKILYKKPHVIDSLKGSHSCGSKWRFKMKRITLLCALLVMSTVSYAEIGRHNLQINIGGGYQKGTRGGREAYTTDFWWGSIHSPARPAVSLDGGMFTLEVGYLFHSVRNNDRVHGFDMRAGFSMSFLEGDYDKIYDQTFEKIYGEFAMTYTLGCQVESGRVMFDIVGVGLTFGSTDTKFYLNGVESLEGEKVFNIGMQYVFPGVQYMMNNGFTIGWRNKFELNLGYILPTFNTTVTLGFTFGSK